MVKIYAISLFYKAPNDAKLLKSHYDLQSFSFFQRGKFSEFFVRLKYVFVVCLRELHPRPSAEFNLRNKCMLAEHFICFQAVSKSFASLHQKLLWNGRRSAPGSLLSRMSICVTFT